jgi:hypothetical protein
LVPIGVILLVYAFNLAPYLLCWPTKLSTSIVIILNLAGHCGKPHRSFCGSSASRFCLKIGNLLQCKFLRARIYYAIDRKQILLDVALPAMVIF